jgi:hypothetical protein
LIELVIPKSVEVLNENCFAKCRSLSSVTFESGSIFSGHENMELIESLFGGMIVPILVEKTSNIKD